MYLLHTTVSLFPRPTISPQDHADKKDSKTCVQAPPFLYSCILKSVPGRYRLRNESCYVPWPCNFNGHDLAAIGPYRQKNLIAHHRYVIRRSLHVVHGGSLRSGIS